MRIEQVLSKRLLAVTELVTKGNRVADIGCDHAYTSIYLVKKGITPYAIAMDINAGPVERAKENVALYGLQDWIVVRRSDGVKELSAQEADTLLITGMGGLLMKKILSDKPEIIQSVKELVLQPQSEVAELRKFLHSIGFVITAEQMLKEDGKYYVMFRAEPQIKVAELSEKDTNSHFVSNEISYVNENVAEQMSEHCFCQETDSINREKAYKYGEILLSERPAIFLEYLQWEKKQKEEILETLYGITTEKAQKRKEALEQEIKELEELLIE